MTPQKPKPQQHGRTQTKLPANWAKDKDAEGNAYYYHEQNGQTAWEAPPGSVQVPVEVVQQHIRTKTKLPENWMKDTDANGHSYYYHATSGATAWEAPPGSTGGSTGVAAAAEGGLLGSNHARSDTALPSGWGKDIDGEGNKYYYNEAGATSWTAPEGSTKDGQTHPDLHF